MYKNAKIFIKILANWFQQHIKKKIITMNSQNLSQECNSASTYEYQCNTIPHWWNVGSNMVILIDAEKAFDKIQCFIIIKVSKIRIERNFLNMIKGIYFFKKPSKHETHWWRSESFPPKIRNKTRVLTSPIAIQHCPVSSNQAIQEEKDIKDIQTGKIEVSLLHS